MNVLFQDLKRGKCTQLKLLSQKGMTSDGAFNSTGSFVNNGCKNAN